MIEFPQLAAAIRDAGPEGRSLGSLENSPTSRAAAGILAARAGFEIMEEHWGEVFDLFKCQDRGADAVRIPSPFALVCLNAELANANGAATETRYGFDVALRNLDLHHHPVILLATSALGEFGTLLEHSAWQAFDYGPEEFVQVLLANPPRARVMTRMVRATSPHALNPYVYKGPIDANLFVGRGRQLEEICSLRASHALIGPRGMGKTSLVHRAYERLLQNGHVAVRCEFSAAMTEHGLLYQILDEFVKVHKCAPLLLQRISVETVERLVRSLSQNGPVAVFMDEADELVARCPRLAAAIRHWHDSGWARFVLIGHKELRRTISDVQRGTLMNVLQNTDLSSLSHHECAELVTGPMAGLQIRLEQPDKIIRTIMRESGGSPSRVQLLCHSLIEEISKSGADRKVTLEDAENAIHLSAVRKVISEWYRYSTSDLEKWLAALATACLPATEDELTRVAQQDLPEISGQTVRSEIQDLVVANVFDYAKEGAIDFAFPAIRAIAKPPGESERAKHDLRMLARRSLQALENS